MFSPNKIRNIAIIAHIDHGKTTLLDSLLKQSNIFRTNEFVPERVMDSYDQERERGITIFSKQTCLHFKDYKINLIDTPGHSDFSGEVERILGMVNSVLLLVDAQEGPMPQTRFVLSKALKMGLNPIVIINKIDRPHAKPNEALDKTFDLFVELGASDEQLDFAYCYASGLGGFAMHEPEDPRDNMQPLFDLMISEVLPPKGNLANPFLMQTTMIDYDDYVGRQSCGRILEGFISAGDDIILVSQNGTQKRHKITRVQGHLGIKKIELEKASVGDIVILSGMPEVMLGDTLCHPSNVRQLPKIHIDEPTVSIGFMVNTGPLVGRDGKHVTFSKIRDRLLREKRSNISLLIEDNEKDSIKVTGRGELQLAVLVEAMRRENFEFTISQPKVVIKEIDGVKHEPLERIHIEVPEEFSGGVIEELSRRKGLLKTLKTNEHNISAMEFLLPSRGLIGYRNEFMTVTRGLGTLTAIFEEFTPCLGHMPGRKNGVLVSMCNGKASGYSCFNLQSRGVLFVNPGDDVYEGMIVGENSRENDLPVNVIKGKQLTNVRASGTDENIVLTPPRQMTIEDAIDFIQDDELAEITPKIVRLRKRFLKEHERKRKK